MLKKIIALFFKPKIEHRRIYFDDEATHTDQIHIMSVPEDVIEKITKGC